MKIDLAPAADIFTIFPQSGIFGGPADVAIDGDFPNFSESFLPPGKNCTGINSSADSWIRIDLKGIYSVSKVRISTRETGGVGVSVHVGNSLLNEGNDNYQCGSTWYYNLSDGFQYGYGKPKDFVCETILWARYINIKQSTYNNQLQVCEVEVYYDNKTADAVLHLHNLNASGATSLGSGEGLTGVTPSRLAIDGEPVFNLGSNQCSKSTVHYDAWLHVDLKEVYSVTAIRTISGSNVSVVVGNNLVTNETNNSLCGEATKEDSDEWHTYSCIPTIDGRYVNLIRFDEQDLPTTLVVCELEIFYGLRIRITYNGSELTATNFILNEGQNLPDAIECGVQPSNANLISSLKMAWKLPNGTNVPQNQQIFIPDVSQDHSSSVQKLWIAKATMQLHGTVSCSFLLNGQENTLSFNITINAIDCSWSEWTANCSTLCGRQVRSRAIENSPSASGLPCNPNSSIAQCVGGLTPCKPAAVQNIVNISENETATLACWGEQYESLSPRINFKWVKIVGGHDVEISLIHQNTVNYPNGTAKGTLTFSPAVRDDTGEYKCIAIGAVGNSSMIISLTVEVTTEPHSANATQLPYAKNPSSPLNLQITRSNTTSLTIKWEPPQNPNGRILKYKVYYRKATNGVDKSLDVPESTSQAVLSDLLSHTNYTISVTAINNATDHSESVRVTITGRTKIAAPFKPVLSVIIDQHKAQTTATFMLPLINDTNGPISYVEVVVHVSTDNQPPEMAKLPFPENLTAYGERVSWYIAAHFSYSNYKSELFTLGNDIKTTDTIRNRDYRNVALQPDSKYFVYILVVGYNDENILIYTYSDATELLTDGIDSGGGDSNTTAVIVAVVIVVCVVAVLVLVLLIIFLRRGHQQQVKHNGEMGSDFVLSNAGVVNGNDIVVPTVEAPTIAREPCNVAVTAFVGTTALLPCDATGQPLPIICWYFNNKSLPGDNKRMMQLKTGALQIENVQLSDGGMYKCTASNQAGQDKQNVVLTVKTTVTDKPKKHRSQLNSILYSSDTDEFPTYIEDLKADDNAGFSDQFKRLEEIGKNFPTTIAQRNASKNRYQHILTYDHACVVLPTLDGMMDCDSDYINGAYIDGFCKPKKYIACQGPLPDTSADMWRMVWAEESPTIVMLTHLVENSKTKCHQYWPTVVSEALNYNGIIVTLKNEEIFADYVLRTIRLQLGNKSRRVKQYHFTSWPDNGVPTYATCLLSFWKRVRREHPLDKGPLVIHCSAGTGRTGTMVAIDTMLDRIENNEPVDIYHCVSTLRTRRQTMVQSETQYVFIHDAVLETVLCGTTEVQVTDLQKYVFTMQAANASAFEKQFEMLQATTSALNKYNCKCGSHPSVQDKNRYPDILPLDSHRVVLQLQQDRDDNDRTHASDYINASLLSSYHKRDAFIITQGPLPSTVKDFWQMIWERDCSTIVMLTRLEEGGMAMCHQYWPTSGSAVHGTITVTMEIELPGLEYSIRRIKLSKGCDTRIVTHFQFTSWPEEKCLTRSAQLLDLISQMQKAQQKSGNKIVTVHCNNGVGRTGTFCAIFSIIEALKVERVVDVFYRIKVLRTQHPGIVQTLEQYIFCHVAVMEYLEGFDTYPK